VVAHPAGGNGPASRHLVNQHVRLLALHSR
jgi:hypothetical protein